MSSTIAFIAFCYIAVQIEAVTYGEVAEAFEKKVAAVGADSNLLTASEAAALVNQLTKKNPVVTENNAKTISFFGMDGKVDYLGCILLLVRFTQSFKENEINRLYQALSAASGGATVREKLISLMHNTLNMKSSKITDNQYKKVIGDNVLTSKAFEDALTNANVN